MEVPNPQSVYNGAQCGGAVASDIEVVPDTEDEVALPGSTMADRHAMSDNMDLDIEDAVSQQSIEVNAITRSCATGRGDNVTGHALVVTNDGAYQRVPVTAQQRYSSQHSHQSDSEPLASQSGMRGMGEQRRLFEDLRAELTEELRFQQSMLAAQQNKAIECLRGDMLRIVNEHRQMQPPLAQVGGAGVQSTPQTEVRNLEDASQ